MRELIQLHKDAQKSQRSAYAEKSFSNLVCQWVTYLQFCQYFTLIPLPACTLQLVWYVQYLSRKLKAHGSLVSYIIGVKTLHTLMNQPVLAFRGVMLRLTMMGLRRNNTHVVRQAKPITPFILKDIKRQLNLNQFRDLIFWCACLVGFFLLFRKSNFLPDTKLGFNGEKQLKFSDFVFLRNKAVVGIRWAKNHQFGRELFTYPLHRLIGSSICPYSALQKLFTIQRQPLSAHIFVLEDGRSSYTYNMFHRKLRMVLAAAGYPAALFSSHSFRRGGATFAFLSGVPLELIKVLGGWRSNAFLSYVDFPLEARTAASELVKKRILQLNL